MHISGVYVLRLINGRYYIGFSENIEKRVWQHMNGQGALWTQEYPPEKLIDIRIGLTTEDEKQLTLIYMRIYGSENVRGGPWCTRILNNNPLFDPQYNAAENCINKDFYHTLKAISKPSLVQPKPLPTEDHPINLSYQQILKSTASAEYFIGTYCCDGDECIQDFNGELPCDWEHLNKLVPAPLMETALPQAHS